MTDQTTETIAGNDGHGSSPYSKESPLSDKKNALMRSMGADAVHAGGTMELPQHAPQKEPENDTGIVSNTILAEPIDMPQERNRPVGLIHTFKDDVQNLVRDQKLSMTKIRALESDQGERETDAIERNVEKSGVLTAIFGGLIALAVVIGGAWYYTTMLAPQKNTSGISLAYGLFFTEGYEQVDISNKVPRATREALALVRKRGAFSIGSLIEIVPTARVRDDATGELTPTRVGSTDLVRALGLRIPTLFSQTIGPLYMVGLHIGDENIPYLVLTTDSYDHAFSGMLTWEKYMEEDLAPFMSPNTTYTPPATTQGGNAFIDTVVRNFDVRVLRDDTGTIRLLYGFANTRTIIITTRVETFLTIAERIRVEN